MSTVPTDLVQGAIAYYGQVTDNYNTYAEGTFGWHYGIWEPGIETHADALLNSNRRLVRGAGLGPSSRVLDVGCGVGGFGTWAASTFGCRVEGITLVDSHVEAASRLASERGVDHLCTFRVMDMNDLAVASDRFDLVTSQETFVHASDKEAFLHEVLRALVPGGRWHAVDMSVRSGALTEAEQEQHTIACESWSMASLVCAHDIELLATSVGFKSFEAEDVTALTLPSARRILDYCRRAEVQLAKIGEDKIARVPQLDALRRHVDGGRAYSRGLERGFFRHCCYYTRKPQRSSGRTV